MNWNSRRMLFMMEILAVTASLLSGCNVKNKVLEKAGLPYHTVGKAVPITEIERISFTENTTAIPAIMVTGINRTANGASILIDIDYQRKEIAYPVDAEILDKVQAILEKYDVGKWNGYSGYNPMALDGSSFALFVQFTDGSSLSAQGTNNFPDNYSNVRREFNSLTSEAIAPWQEEYEAGTDVQSLDNVMEIQYGTEATLMPGEFGE